MGPGWPTAGTTIVEISDKYDLRSVLRRYDRADVARDPIYAKALELHAMWARWAEEAGGLPARRRVDPLEIGAKLLPHMVLLDVLGDGADFRWRLFGGRHAAEFGADLTGTLLSRHLSRNPGSRAARALFFGCYRDAAPLWYALEYMAATQVVKRAHGVMLPLAGEAGGGRVEHLLSVTDWSRSDPRDMPA